MQNQAWSETVDNSTAAKPADHRPDYGACQQYLHLVSFEPDLIHDEYGEEATDHRVDCV
jgi:hypothetical protein